MINLSVVILTKNNQSNIERTIKSASFAKEILLIDDNSTDNTLNLAKKYGARVFNRKLNNNFSQQRNFGLKQAREEWVLFLDADEEISEKLIEELKNIKLNCKSYYIKRRDIFWGRVLRFGELNFIYNNGLVRLVSKNSGKWEGFVHEKFISNSESCKLNGFINHYSHNSIKDFINDINFYSTIRAKELQKTGKKTNVLQIIFFPLTKFIINYIFKFGFLDGIQGFIYSFMMSFHSFLVRAKLYQYSNLSK